MLRDLISLGSVARRRLRSPADYRQFQARQADLILRYLASRGIDLAGRTVLDLGAGLGGYSEALATQAGRVWSLDLTPHASTAAGPCRPVQADALQTPFRAGSIDFVFCASLIEHVPFPGDLMREIRRVLRTGGVCYLSFPPFFAPQGGHEFAPFHYLGERAALWLRKRAAPPPPWVREMYAPTENPRSFAEAYRGWGLYRMTISRARGLIRESGLAVTDMRPRYVWFNTAALPILGEFLTWHVQFLLVKREPASP